MGSQGGEGGSGCWILAKVKVPPERRPASSHLLVSLLGTLMGFS